MANRRRNGEDEGSGEAVRVEVSFGAGLVYRELTWYFVFCRCPRRRTRSAIRAGAGEPDESTVVVHVLIMNVLLYQSASRRREGYYLHRNRGECMTSTVGYNGICANLARNPSADSFKVVHQAAMMELYSVHGLFHHRVIHLLFNIHDNDNDDIVCT